MGHEIHDIIIVRRDAAGLIEDMLHERLNHSAPSDDD